jgi:ubiquinone/menaquinone biosynthesis C-methylase UbiE
MNFSQWSRYWQSGQLTSLPQDFSQNYDGEILSYWHKTLAGLDKGSAVLDVCTGNGAIALLAQQYSDANGMNFSVMAVDAADINLASIRQRFPDLTNTLDAIQFQSNINIEQMELGKQFDLVTSQYGVEYTDWNKTAHSISAHLKPAGFFQMITHAPETEITHYMKQERFEYDSLIRLEFFKQVNSVLSQQLKYPDFKRYVKKLLKQLKGNSKLKRSPLIIGVMNFCNHTLNTSEDQFNAERTMLDNFYLDHLSAYQRLVDILTVSERIEAQPDWYQVFTQYDLELLERQDIYQQSEHLAGIGLLFKRTN